MSFVDWYHNNQDWIMLVCMFVTLATILTIFYFLNKKGMDVFYTRKGVHITVGSYIFFWLMASDNWWARYVAMIPAALTAIVFLFVGLKVIRFNFLVRSMSRDGEPTDLLKGTFIYAIMMSLICAFIWREQPWGLIAIMAVAFGDGIAPIAGRHLGKHKYWSIGGGEKSLEGSLFMFLCSVAMSFLITYIFGVVLTGQNWLWGYADWPWLWGKILILCLIGTIAEGLSPKDFDNLIVPVVMILISLAFGLKFSVT
ncbi:MAG: diacylglycerol/polyprenol kinase family protein [Candidatus Heimdallarchaeota archaeon]